MVPLIHVNFAYVFFVILTCVLKAHVNSDGSRIFE